MGEETIGHRIAAPMQVFDRPPEIERVPIRDRGDDQVQPGGAMLLVLNRAIGKPALPMSIDRLRQRVPRLAFVQPSLASPA
jgi:hypothetical protein